MMQESDETGRPSEADLDASKTNNGWVPPKSHKLTTQAVVNEKNSSFDSTISPQDLDGIPNQSVFRRWRRIRNEPVWASFPVVTFQRLVFLLLFCFLLLIVCLVFVVKSLDRSTSITSKGVSSDLGAQQDVVETSRSPSQSSSFFPTLISVSIVDIPGTPTTTEAPTTSQLVEQPTTAQSQEPTSTLFVKPTAATSTRPSSAATQASTPLTWTRIEPDIEGLTLGEELGKIVAVSNNGNRIWAGGYDMIRMYDLLTVQEGRWAPTFDFSPFLEESVSRFSTSANGRYFIAGDSGLDSGKGGAYVFHQLDGGSMWEQRGQIVKGNQFGDGLGVSVAISDDGNNITVGAFESNYVKVLFWNEDTWVLRFELSQTVSTSTPAPTPLDVLSIDDYDQDDNSTWDDNNDDEIDWHLGFGVSISMSADGSKLIVGAPYTDDNEVNSGSAFFYNLLNGSIMQKVDGDESYDQLGNCVAISADATHAVIGTEFGGYVKVFNFDPVLSQYVKVGENIAGGYDTNFGYSVAISSDGGRVAIGAPLDSEGGPMSGKAVVYDINNISWEEVGTFIGVDEYDFFGESVALSEDGKFIAIGGPLHDVDGSNDGHISMHSCA